MGESFFRGGLIAVLWLFAAGTGWAMELAARDARSGAALAVRVDIAHPDGLQHLDVGGELKQYRVPAGRSGATARAAGYHDLYFMLDPAARAMTLLLDPVVEPDAVLRLSAEAARDPDGRWLHGWVRRNEDGSAITGARIDFEGRVAYSDAEGHFLMALPSCGPGDMTRSRLRTTAVGFEDQVRDGLICTPGVQTRLVALGQGTSAYGREVIGALDRPDAAVSGEAPDAMRLVPFPSRLQTPIGTLVAPELAPPASIRVGYANAACTDIFLFQCHLDLGIFRHILCLDGEC